MKLTRWATVAGLILLPGCTAQNSDTRRVAASDSARPDLYQCEGCEGALEANPASLTASAQLALPDEPGERMQIQGVVFATDGQTPAPNVIVYAYQTNAQGLYANGTPETEASRRHGRLRGWVRTGQDGRYSFDTIKPAPYSNEQIPAHVHFTVLEPGRRSYWIDDIVFSGEFGVSDAYRRSMTNKGGDGVVTLTRAADGTWLARRDIFLERHPA